MKPKTPDRMFITVRDVANRWSCNPVTVKRMVTRDPSMPRPFKLTKWDVFRVSEIEEYERKKATAR